MSESSEPEVLSQLYHSVTVGRSSYLSSSQFPLGRIRDMEHVIMRVLKQTLKNESMHFPVKEDLEPANYRIDMQKP